MILELVSEAIAVGEELRGWGESSVGPLTAVEIGSGGLFSEVLLLLLVLLVEGIRMSKFVNS